MGCFQSKEEPGAPAVTKEREVAQLRKAVWAAEQPTTAADLKVRGGPFHAFIHTVPDAAVAGR